VRALLQLLTRGCLHAFKRAPLLIFPDSCQSLSIDLETPEYDGDNGGTLAYMDLGWEPCYFLERSLENSALRIWKDKTSGRVIIITLNLGYTFYVVKYKYRPDSGQIGVIVNN